MKLLYAEDEKALSDAVVDILTHHRFNVDVVDNGNDAVAYASVEEYDGIILDIMMPGKNGFEVLKELRMAGNATPVLLLTARGALDDRVTGLDLGADDYLIKPFAMKELLARIRAMLRRRDTYVPEVIEFGNSTLDPGMALLAGPKGSTNLSRLEFLVLELLLLNREARMSPERILERVWGYESEASVNTLWVYISQLRKKLADVGSDYDISSKRGFGYCLEKRP